MPTDMFDKASKLWLDKFQSALYFGSRGELKKAESIWCEAIEIAIQSNLSADQLLNTYLAYVNLLKENGKTEQAIICLVRAINYSREKKCEKSAVHMNLIAELGMTYFCEDNDELAIPVLQQAIALHKRKRAQMEPEFLWILFALTTSLLRFGEFDKAVEIVGELIRRSVKIHGRKHATTLAAFEFSRFAHQVKRQFENEVTAG
jgi:tetratricopeptide (TPR) repeat protein